MRKEDRTYFVRRAMEEREAARRAACPQAAAAHREMEALYINIVSKLTDEPGALSA